MITPDGPKVIEYNCRFGDPETQAVLPLLESDLLTVMRACTDGTLSEKYETGFPITVESGLDAELYIAGAKLSDGALLTAGGRVLGVTAVADTLPEAVEKAYREGEKAHFLNEFFRHDIGARALAAKRG